MQAHGDASWGATALHLIPKEIQGSSVVPGYHTFTGRDEEVAAVKPTAEFVTGVWTEGNTFGEHIW